MLATLSFLPASDLLAQYARHHRDPRNISMHLAGVPLVVLALGVLTARATVPVAGVGVSLAWLLWGLASLWYLTRGEALLGAVATLGSGVLVALAHPLAGGAALTWLSWSLGFFALGWALQFLGHYYEGHRPPLAGWLTRWLVAPLFVAAEWLFAMGWCRDLAAAVEHLAGPVRLRDLHSPAA